jgi:hypothetical protein
MNNMKNCRVCESELTEANWMPSLQKRNSAICRPCHNKKGNKWRADNPEQAKALSRKWYHKQPKRSHEVTSKHRRKLRTETIIEYGGKCAKCGIDDHDVLDVDHIFNDGAIDRKKHLFAYNLYRELKRLGYPKDRHQLLCKNCNWKKELERRRESHSKSSKQ